MTEFLRFLDAKGRCCGRRPATRKSEWIRPNGPYKQCEVCRRAFDAENGRQRANRYWRSDDGNLTFYKRELRA
jgi:hypothetical protein